MKHVIIRLFSSLYVLYFTIQQSFAAGIAGEKSVSIPYCQNKSDCGFKKGIDEVGKALEGSGVYVDKEETFVTYIQKIIAEHVLVYLYFIMVVIIIYAGFMILTAAGDEDKVSKGKKIILYAIIGVVVIYLAGPLTDFIFTMFNAK